MDDQGKVEPDYIKGFNEGYLLAQHKPELAEKLVGINSDFIRLTGFKDGHKQYIIEQERLNPRLPTWMKEDRFAKQKDAPDRSKNRDRGIEPEK